MSTRPSTTKSMGSGLYITAAGGPAKSSGGTGKIINAAAGGKISVPAPFSGKFINAAGGRK